MDPLTIMAAATAALKLGESIFAGDPASPTVASGGKGQRIINPIQLQLLDTTPGIQNLFRLLNSEEQKKKKASVPATMQSMLGGTNMMSPLTGGRNEA